MSQAELTRLTNTEPESSWKSLYKIGGVTALIALIVAPAEVAIGLLPGVDHALTNTVTAVDWFTLFQNHWFLGLRSFGLLNIVGAVLLVPSILAIYSVLKRENEAYGTFGAILFFVGVAVYFANNRAFSMLSLSSQYASAATDVQRSLVAAAGQAMLAEGQSRAGILLIEFACLLISAVMLGGNIFSRATAWTGMLGNVLMMIVEIAFMPPRGMGMVIAACGGLSIVTWYALVGRRLLQLGRLKQRSQLDEEP
jgi:hypothetical protein